MEQFANNAATTLNGGINNSTTSITVASVTNFPTSGNYRILTTMAAELLAVAAKRELPQLDEKLYLEVFAQPDTSTPRRAGSRR